MGITQISASTGLVILGWIPDIVYFWFWVVKVLYCLKAFWTWAGTYTTCVSAWTLCSLALGTLGGVCRVAFTPGVFYPTSVWVTYLKPSVIFWDLYLMPRVFNKIPPYWLVGAEMTLTFVWGFFSLPASCSEFGSSSLPSLTELHLLQKNSARDSGGTFSLHFDTSSCKFQPLLPPSSTIIVSLNSAWVFPPWLKL